MQWSKQTRYIFIYHLFGCLWISSFIIGCAQFIIAAACATWYFSFTSDTRGHGSVRIGVKWIFSYHFGSIAFGSCIIAIVQMIRIIFEYYRQKIQAANKNNKVVKFFLCITSYLLCCLERCVKFITKNAYIQVALTSKNFCKSAMNGFLLVVKNALRFGITGSIGCIFMFIGKLFIIALTVIVCYLMLIKWPKAAESISSPYFPCIVAGVLAYAIGSVFMSIFSFASDTIL
jgi:choline transporter-like protein 2/4/5